MATRSVRETRPLPWDRAMTVLAVLHGAVVAMAPMAPVIALGLWWNSNTISHNFIHRPFFRSRWANAVFGAYLSLLLGIPQRLWRERHLAHHAGLRWQFRVSAEAALQVALVSALWVVLAVDSPLFFVESYLPGYLGGLGLCWLQGYWEHARGATSHYSRTYNLLFFNDGYHVEHHLHPSRHWTRLAESRQAEARQSAWPAVLRWMESLRLVNLARR